MSLATHGLPFTKLTKALPAPVLQELLVYYGYPISYKGYYDVDLIAAEISTFKYWIVGDSYSAPTHPEYASTVSIINKVRAAGTKVYGYVPIGQSTQGLSIAVIKTRIDEWANIGVDGIFLDEFGFDYGNTRVKQVEIVNYVHGKNLPVCANTWTAHDFVCDNIAELPWGSGDWRYGNFATYNPGNLPIARWSKDAIMLENFCFDHQGPMNVFDVQERASLTTTLVKNKNVKLWALAVFGETTPGTVDPVRLGNLNNLSDAGAYIAANAYIYGIDIVGSGGFSFGSNGTPVRAPLPIMPAAATAATSPYTDNYVSCEATRTFGTVTLTVKNLDGVQSTKVETSSTLVVSFDNVSKSASLVVTPAKKDSVTFVVADPVFFKGMLVVASLVPNIEHDADELAVVGLLATAVNGGVEFTLSTDGILVGTYKVLYNKG